MKTIACRLGTILLLTISATVSAQSTALTCKELQNGIFYNYPKNSSAQYIDERNDDLLKETDKTSGDTSVWKVAWQNTCTYSLTYVKGNVKMTPEIKTFVQDHKMLFKIGVITEDYYVFDCHVDKMSNPLILTDTMWMHEKLNVPNNELFRQVKNAYALKKDHFTDTSKYAVLYVYRPGQPGNFALNYLLYFDDNIMCVAKNNTSYIFKVLKEGSFKILSKINKDEASAMINIKFGQKYYIKTIPNWGFFKFKTYKLENKVMDQDEGEKEFSRANAQ